MRNSNCVAIAPTATISNIIGRLGVHRASYQNIFVKSNLSGEFTVVNEYLVNDLKQRNLWDEVMISDLKYLTARCRRSTVSPGRVRAVCDRVRDRHVVGDRGGCAAPEVDRPGAVAEHLRRAFPGRSSTRPTSLPGSAA
jgi:hypothetical protein